MLLCHGFTRVSKCARRFGRVQTRMYCDTEISSGLDVAKLVVRIAVVVLLTSSEQVAHGHVANGLFHKEFVERFTGEAWLMARTRLRANVHNVSDLGSVQLFEKGRPRAAPVYDGKGAARGHEQFIPGFRLPLEQ